MKIYFGFTVAGDRSAVSTARRIVELMEDMGHEVLTKHLVRNDAWDADRLIGPQDVYERDMRWLQECDLFMAEVSGSSFGLGFETGYVLGAVLAAGTAVNSNSVGISMSGTCIRRPLRL